MTIQENVTLLRNCPFEKILERSSFIGEDDFIVRYVNFLIDDTTGKILEVSPKNKVYFREGATSIPVRIKTKIFGNQTVLEPLPERTPSPVVCRVLQASLEEFHREETESS